MIVKYFLEPLGDLPRGFSIRPRREFVGGRNAAQPSFLCRKRLCASQADKFESAQKLMIETAGAPISVGTRAFHPSFYGRKSVAGALARTAR
jgi:hypothetical protein